MTSLLEATVISAGFAATTASFMLSSDTLDQYNRYAKYTHVSIVLFAVSAVIEAVRPGNAFAPFIFSAGWIMLLTSLGSATFSAEIVGVQANIRHRLQWLYQYRFRGWLREEPRTPNPVTYRSFDLRFLQPLYDGSLVRGTSVLVSGPAETNRAFFAYQIALEGLQNEEHVIYVNTKRVPAQVRDHLTAAGATMDHFHIIDIYNPSFGLGEIPITGVKEEHRAKTLKGLHREIRRIRMKIGLEDDRYRVRILYDDINLLSNIMGVRGTNKFILHSLPVETVLGWVSVYIGSSTYDETPIYNNIKNLSDIILQLDSAEALTDRSHRLRLVKAQDCAYNARWRPYTVQGRATRLKQNGAESFDDFIRLQTSTDLSEERQSKLK